MNRDEITDSQVSVCHNDSTDTISWHSAQYVEMKHDICMMERHLLKQKHAKVKRTQWKLISLLRFRCVGTIVTLNMASAQSQGSVGKSLVGHRLYHTLTQSYCHQYLLFMCMIIIASFNVNFHSPCLENHEISGPGATWGTAGQDAGPKSKILLMQPMVLCMKICI